MNRAMVIILRNEGALAVMDANGVVHRVEDGNDLAQICNAILDDPTIPPLASSPTSRSATSARSPSPVPVGLTDAELAVYVESVAEFATQGLAQRLEALVPLVAPAIRGARRAVEQRRQTIAATEQQRIRDEQSRAARMDSKRRLVRNRRKLAVT